MRVLIVFAVFVAILLLGYFSGGMTFLAKAPTGAPVDPTERTFRETRQGQLLFVPLTGNRCRKLLFNNATGKFSEIGTLPCTELLEAPKPAEEDSYAERFGKMRDSFVNRN